MPVTYSQDIAARVHTQIKTQEDKPKDFIKDYGRLCNRFPILVLENGLAQAVGYLSGKAKKPNAEYVFLGHLAEILNQEPHQFLDTVLTASLSDYRRLTRRTLAAAVWYKRFAQGVLGIDATGESEDDKNAENSEN